MTPIVFNLCLLAGWLLIMGGLALVSVPLALVAGGVVLMAVTLLLARWVGLARPRKGNDVPR